ncbi:MAG TPA: hypothetical protein VF553_21620 [Pyrinomonadaceae bacterium]|jgi:hypothetical protein
MSSSTQGYNISGLRTSADAVRYLAPQCVEPFFSGESFARLLRTAEAFPASLSLNHMFERQLGTATSPVDFFHWLTRPRGGDFFNGHPDVLSGASEGMPEAFFQKESWQRIRRFAREWLDDDSPLHEVLGLWLEYDIRERPLDVPIPLIFFTIDQNLSPEPALEILHHRPYASPQLATFRRCWEALPSTSRYRTAGILYSRPTEAIRLIFIMTHDDAFRYLERVGWPGSVNKLSERVREFLRFHTEVALHLDAHPEGVEPQVGMEIYTDAEALYKGITLDCEPLLNVAVEQSLCLPELRDALITWPGADTFQLPLGEMLRVERKFHHVKVVSQPDLSLRAKAYTTAEFEVIK